MFNVQNQYHAKAITIQVLGSLEAQLIVATMLVDNWCFDSAEGDGEISWDAARKQADDMVRQTTSNRLNLESYGVAVQWVTTSGI